MQLMGWERENVFSSREKHWVCQPHSRASPVLKSSWPTQMVSLVVCLLALRERKNMKSGGERGDEDLKELWKGKE